MPIFSNSVSDTSPYSASKAQNSGAILECQLLFQHTLGPSWPWILHYGMVIQPLNFPCSLACSLTLPRFTLLRDSDSALSLLGFFHVLKEVNLSYRFCFTSFLACPRSHGIGKEMFCKLFQNFIITKC